jgi:alpha-beta hydrolase superfamily lysophospholipase
MSSTSRKPGCMAALRSGMAAILLASMLVFSFGQANAEPLTNFYNAPAKLAANAPGTLLNYQPLPVPAFFKAKAWRILYATRDYRGRPILSSGMVVLPHNASRDTGKRSIVAWAHPTIGIARQCAPSLLQDPLHSILGLNDLLASGHIIAATDYPGLGTVGPTGYMVGKGQANAVIDSVRAARQIPQVGGSGKYALLGYSQGGHATVFASLFGDSYAPELDLLGLAAIAPPMQLAPLLLEDIGSMEGRVLTSFVVGSWSRKFGLNELDIVAPAALPVMAEINNSCLSSFEDKFSIFSNQAKLKEEFLTGSPLKNPDWRRALALNSVSNLSAHVPSIILQGSQDRIVRPGVTAQVIGSSCRSGARIKFVTLPSAGHGGSAKAGISAAVNWINDRFKGLPAPSNCR